MTRKKKQELLLYKESDFHRKIVVHTEEEQFKTIGRSCFWRDYARLIHTPSFRRLKGKTQLFPGYDSDFFRCRLTHSIEVGQIAKSIANSLNKQIEKKFPPSEFILDGFNSFINTDLIEFSCYAHDLGHPPFGHQGEAELDILMLEHGGFEGNAQTLRILSKIEKKYKEIPNKGNELILRNGFNEKGEDKRHGLSLTARSLASIIKYDSIIQKNRKNHITKKGIVKDTYKLYKGYYYTEEDLVREIKYNVTGNSSYENFKTIECSIMDIADDIAYSIYDLEDAFKAGFTHPYNLFCEDDKILNSVVEVINEKGKEEGLELFIKCSIVEIRNIMRERLQINKIVDNVGELSEHKVNQASIVLARDGYSRNVWTSDYVSDLIRKVEIDTSNKIPALWEIKINEETLLHIEVLKRLTYHFQISSPKLKVIEFRGRGIVRDIFNVLKRDEDKGIKGWEFMPEDYADLYLTAKNNLDDPSLKYRVICDFISGMTDKYALEYRNRLYSSNLSSIHKQF